MSNIWYGSLNNRLAERAQQPSPVVGMGVTECCYSDRHPWEIIEVKSRKTAKKRAPWASRIAAVCGGFLAFESIADIIANYINKEQAK